MSQIFKTFPRYSGALAVVLMWLVVKIGMLRSGLQLIDERPLSYIGSATESAAIFNSGLILSAVLFSVFGIYLYKNISHDIWFLGWLLMSQLALIVLATFAYDGASKTIHTVAAFTFALTTPFLMRSFTHSLAEGVLKTRTQLLYRVEIVFFVIGIGAFIFIDGIAPIAEILPALPFHALVLYLTAQMTTPSNTD